MARTTAAAAETTAVASPCDVTPDKLQASMDESFELTASSITSELTKAQSSLTAADALTQINAALANTGDAAPVLQVSVDGTTAATYQGSFTGQAVVTLDGQTIGTKTLTLPAPSGAMQQTVSIPLSGTLTATATSKFDVAVTGTLKMTCPASDTTSHTVSATAGLPSLTLYQHGEDGTSTSTSSGG